MFDFDSYPGFLTNLDPSDKENVLKAISLSGINLRWEDVRHDGTPGGSLWRNDIDDMTDTGPFWKQLDILCLTK